MQKGERLLSSALENAVKSQKHLKKGKEPIKNIDEVMENPNILKGHTPETFLKRNWRHSKKDGIHNGILKTINKVSKKTEKIISV